MGARSRCVPCFDAQMYYIAVNHCNVNRCIAPRADGQQCSNKIRPDEVRELIQLQEELASATNTKTQRDNMVERIVLLRCCCRWHRRKLNGNAEVLQQVVTRYDNPGNDLPWTVAIDKKIRQPQRATKSLCISSNHGYRLRPRRRGTFDEAAILEDREPESSVFVPYSAGHLDDVRTHLKRQVTDKNDGRGFVYAFVWPDNPDYVKIGSCKSSPEGRLQSWQACHPNARLVHSIAVPFRKRTEQLIHRELSSRRCRMVVCTNCLGSHVEWFRMAEDEVALVLQAWEELTTRGQLYARDGTLETMWRERLGQTQRELTASRLLGICRAQQRRLASVERAEERIVELHRQAPRRPKHKVSTSRPCGDPASEVGCWRAGEIQVTWRCDWDMLLVYYCDFRLLSP